MIEVQGLTKRYGPFTAVHDLSFTVASGEILGFLGPNGAGKTTTMRVLTGFFPPTEGTARVAGHDVVAEPLAAKARTGYLPESPPLYPEMSARDCVDFAARLHQVDAKTRTSRVEAALERCALEDVKDVPTSRLSKGYRQRVGLAQALVHDPEVLVLDEPTAGLDPKQIGETRELIRGLGGDHTVILSTHILPEVSMTCDRVVILHDGRLVAQGTPEGLQEQFGERGVVHVTVAGTKEDAERTLLATEGVEGVESLPSDRSGEVALRVEVAASTDARREIAARLVGAGLGLLELRQAGMSLEEVYLNAISRESSP